MGIDDNDLIIGIGCCIITRTYQKIIYDIIYRVSAKVLYCAKSL